MKFNVFMTTVATLALVEATAAMNRQFGNGTTVVVPTLTGTGWSNMETMPTLQPTNSSDATAPVTSSDIFEITTTVVGSTTLSYTLGPEGSSSVVTTVIENTSTITMTTTMYITMTMTRPDEPTLSSVDDGLTPTAEPTVTVTEYLTTKTITMQNAQAGASNNASPNDGSNSDSSLDLGSDGTNDPDDTDTNLGSGPGAFFPSDDSGSDAAFSTTTPGNLFGGGQDGACGVTTITETVVEKSTVTVTPTSTDNFPIDPTASPTYGFGNGTDPTSGYPTASSGFLTFIRRSQPTKM